VSLREHSVSDLANFTQYKYRHSMGDIDRLN
jgi:hypothetical protein